ncbi:MAG: MerR family transcriptional regulator [Solibacillus sp.]
MLIREVALLSGVSQRTLRYYEEKGLLTPAYAEGNGYRRYREHDLDRLQQILFYRELDFPLKEIKRMMEDSAVDRVAMLLRQKELLEKKSRHMEQLIRLIDETIVAEKDGIKMTNEQKFEAFKQNLVDNHEQKYGDEVRAKYGEQALMWTNEQLKNMTEEQYAALQKIERSLFERLAEAMEIGDSENEVAMEVAELHKRWLQFQWKKYTKQAHAGLAMLYVSDERFTAYYDCQVGTGATKFLTEIIQNYTKSV